MRATATLLVCIASGVASSSAAQTTLQTVASPQATTPQATTPQAAINESSIVAAPAASGPASPAPPLVAPLPAPVAVFQARPSLECADFKRALGGGWSALAAIQLPGPRGLMQITPGQTFGPGDYGSGLDVAAILERDCPQAPPPS